MAPQPSIPVAANILGTFGTVLLCVQLVPQVWHIWKTKDVDGFPAKMMFLWATCMSSGRQTITTGQPNTYYQLLYLGASILLCRYAFNVRGLPSDADYAQNFNIPLQIQSQIFCALSWVSFGQILIYGQ